MTSDYTLALVQCFCSCEKVPEDRLVSVGAALNLADSCSLCLDFVDICCASAVTLFRRPDRLYVNGL